MWIHAHSKQEQFNRIEIVAKRDDKKTFVQNNNNKIIRLIFFQQNGDSFV